MAGRGVKGPYDRQREDAMAEAYRSGLTLQEIGDRHGVSRERVRQIITKNYGLTRNGGGAHATSVTRRAARAEVKGARAEARCLKAYGCSIAERDDCMAGQRIAGSSSPAVVYRTQKRSAEGRGIRWEITLPQWWRVWTESGRWNQRGRRRAITYLARRRNTGPYAVWNVYITTLADNAADYQAELKRNGILCADGYRRLPGNPAIETVGVADAA